MRKTGVVAALLLPGVALVSGCATKGYVNDVVGLERTQSDQRFAQVEGRMGDATRRVEGAEARIGDTAQRVEGIGVRVTGVEQATANATALAGNAQNRANEALGRADQAGLRADRAHARADEVNARVSRLWTSRNARNRVESFDVKFRFGKADLDDRAQTALLDLVRELQQNPQLTVDLQGFADPTGSLEGNVRLSQRRVEAVRRYLVEKGIELPRIHAIGLGPIADTSMPASQKRRVTVNVMVAAE